MNSWDTFFIFKTSVTTIFALPNRKKMRGSTMWHSPSPPGIVWYKTDGKKERKERREKKSKCDRKTENIQRRIETDTKILSEKDGDKNVKYSYLSTFILCISPDDRVPVWKFAFNKEVVCHGSNRFIKYTGVYFL